MGVLLPFAVLQVLSLEARRLEVIDDLPPDLVALLVEIAGKNEQITMTSYEDALLSK